MILIHYPDIIIKTNSAHIGNNINILFYELNNLLEKL